MPDTGPIIPHFINRWRIHSNIWAHFLNYRLVGEPCWRNRKPLKPLIQRDPFQHIPITEMMFRSIRLSEPKKATLAATPFLHLPLGGSMRMGVWASISERISKQMLNCISSKIQRHLWSYGTEPVQEWTLQQGLALHLILCTMPC